MDPMQDTAGTSTQAEKMHNENLCDSSVRTAGEDEAPVAKDKKTLKAEKERQKMELKVVKKAVKQEEKVNTKIEKKKRQAVTEEGEVNREVTKGVDPEVYAEYHRQKAALKVQGYAQKKEAKVNKKYSNGTSDMEVDSVCGERGNTGEVKCIDPALVNAYHQQKAQYKIEAKRAKNEEKVARKKAKVEEKIEKKATPTDGARDVDGATPMEVDPKKQKYETKLSEYEVKRAAKVEKYASEKDRKAQEKAQKKVSKHQVAQ